MTPLAIRRAVRPTSRLTCFLLALSLCVAAGRTFAAVVGDQVELTATHRSGVPFHHAPGGTQGFQRVHGGTVATVMGTAREGRWLQISLPDQRTGWIAARYVGRTIAGSPPPEPSSERLVWTSPVACQQVVASGGRMAPADPAILRVGTWNIHIPPDLVVERVRGSLKASRGEDLQIEEPITCGHSPTLDFHTTVAAMLGPTLIRY